MTIESQDDGEGRYLGDRRLSELMTVPVPPTTPEEQERHRIYCYLLLYLLNEHWNPYKYGCEGEYPWAEGTNARRSTYLGHNIAAIAVSPTGRIVDFDFNHNELFNSSAEHAEARLLRRLFALGKQFAERLDREYIEEEFNKMQSGIELDPTAGSETHHKWWYRSENTMSRTHFGRTLARITIYTSLESCAQCSGMMALGAVEKVVYLQADPGQNHIGAILFNLNGGNTAFKSPLPVPASEYGVAEYTALSHAYSKYLKQIQSSRVKSFYKMGDENILPSSSLTTFLCTSAAKKILQSAAYKFSREKEYPVGLPFPLGSRLQYGDWQPSPTALTNREVWGAAELFAQGTLRYGRRGTPHRS
ncbi:MAG: hypothetical protein IH627_12320 [Rubrivivax sp.]|nr:hypothetical protein [Rubrivivax sp.]